MFMEGQRMSLINDTIKIKYVREGYMQNYPPHLLSDKEMVDAFLKLDEDIPQGLKPAVDFLQSDKASGYLLDMYVLPCIDLFDMDNLYKSDEDTLTALVDLVAFIHITCNNQLKAMTQTDELTLPDWLYSYMLKSVVGPMSDTAEIHDLLVMMNLDNLDDVFTIPAYQTCLDVSRKWIAKLPATEGTRFPTPFGEGHVIKSLRLSDVRV